jgi:hypothetical protein
MREQRLKEQYSDNVYRQWLKKLIWGHYKCLGLGEDCVEGERILSSRIKRRLVVGSQFTFRGNMLPPNSRAEG